MAGDEDRRRDGGLRVTFLTPGTGSYYCGACMRDNTLANALHRAGHGVEIMPMYLPLTLDEPGVPGLGDTPIFFGGVNVYLQQKFSWFRRAPQWLDNLLNSGRLLRGLAERSRMTSARDHGEMAFQMLRCDPGAFGKEIDKLVRWLEGDPPSVVVLSTAMQAGLARELKARLRVPVVVCFQGEDSFLDALPAGFRGRCWALLAERLGDADMLIAPSEYYAAFMGERLSWCGRPIRVVPNGIELDGYGGSGPGSERPAVGFFARMTREKGADLMVDAFIHLRMRLGDARTRLLMGGAMSGGDRPFVEALRRRLVDVGLGGEVEWHANVTREAKQDLLRRAWLFSVPARYPEAFGLYLVEAMASGVPAVMPDHAAFPEIIVMTGGGVCVSPEDPVALAEAWRALLADDPRRMALGRAAREGVERHYGAEAMAERFLEGLKSVVSVPDSALSRSHA